MRNFCTLYKQEYNNVKTPNLEIPTLPFRPETSLFSANISDLPFSLNILLVFETSLFSMILCRFSLFNYSF